MVTTSWRPSPRAGPTTRARFSFAVAVARLIARAPAPARRTPAAPVLRHARRGSRPIASSAAVASSRVARPESSIEFARRLRLCANAAVTARFTAGKSDGSGRRRNATSAESTFGWGRKTVRETAWKPVRSAASWMSTETAPYAFVPGAAKKRSATSRWTITHQSSTLGRPSRLSTTSGVAMLYGRFATSLAGAGLSAPRSIASASPKWSSTFARPVRRFTRAGSSERSSSTA